MIKLKIWANTPDHRLQKPSINYEDEKFLYCFDGRNDTHGKRQDKIEKLIEKTPNIGI